MTILSGTITEEKIKAINERHLEVSRLVTPPEYIEKDQWRKGADGRPIEYPATEYMRSVCRSYYGVPGWMILNSREIYNHNGKLIAVTVHGQLIWVEEGITYAGDMVASHQVQYKKNTDDLVDLGNDTKAANTDCWKKALNFHLNICDDVYRWQDPMITKEQQEKIEEIAKKLDDKHPEKEAISRNLKILYYVNRANYTKKFNYINNLLKEQ